LNISFIIVGETLARLGILESQRKTSKDIVKKSFTEFKTTIEQTVMILKIQLRHFHFDAKSVFVSEKKLKD
jgi:hypothetical protein